LFGSEAGIHFHPKAIPWLHIKGVYSAVKGKKQKGDYLPFIPAQKFRYEIKAEKEKLAFLQHPTIWMSALSALKQNHPSKFETETDGYTVVNAGLSAEILLNNQALSIGLTFSNLFNTRYFEHLSTLKSMHYYNQGRNISLMLKVPLAIK